MINYSDWDLKDEFTIYQASHLWFGVDPNNVEGVSEEAISKSWNFMATIQGAVRRGRIKSADSVWDMIAMDIVLKEKGIAMEMQDYEVYVRAFPRADLRSYAENNGWKPPFLFPEERGKESLHTEDKQPSFRHSPDFRSVTLNGESFALTTQQARVIECLYDAYTNETPDISGAYIFEKIDSTTSEENLRRAFFKHDKKTYDALIESRKKGIYRLKVE